jgi:hypothetical protein
MAIGALIGGLFGLGMGIAESSAKDSAAKDAAKRTNEYNSKVYEFQYGSLSSGELGGEALRVYEHEVEGLEIAKRNNEANLRFQEETLLRRYDYEMGIRDYEYSQAVKLYDRSVSQALKQRSFNELAETAALVDQDRLIHEQLLTLAFDETETLLAYGAAAAGVGMQQRKSKAGAATEAQATRISALKATGAAAARGQAGSSAAKNVQGILAETGARQAAIIDQLMFDTEASEFKLFNMSQQLMLDKAGFKTSRESAKMADISARNKLRQQRLQADIQAEAQIALVPEIAPPMPIPLALPRPKYREVFKPAKPPKPMEAVAMTSNPFLSAMSSAVSYASTGLSIEKGLSSGKEG